MSRSWNGKELQLASAQMVKMGHLSYEEFCEKLKNGDFIKIKTATTEITATDAGGIESEK